MYIFCWLLKPIWWILFSKIKNNLVKKYYKKIGIICIFWEISSSEHADFWAGTLFFTLY